jgi:hypothetical protein
MCFPTVVFWAVGCQLGGSEQDLGTLYPTLMEDTNGNQIAIHYAPGAGVGTPDSSARITRIDDARWTTGSNGTYTFTYNSDAIPHLTAIANDIHTAEKHTSLTRATRRSTIRSTTARSPPRRCSNPCRLPG